MPPSKRKSAQDEGPRKFPKPAIIPGANGKKGTLSFSGAAPARRPNASTSSSSSSSRQPLTLSPKRSQSSNSHDLTHSSKASSSSSATTGSSTATQAYVPPLAVTRASTEEERETAAASLKLVKSKSEAEANPVFAGLPVHALGVARNIYDAELRYIASGFSPAAAIEKSITSSSVVSLAHSRGCITHLWAIRFAQAAHPKDASAPLLALLRWFPEISTNLKRDLAATLIRHHRKLFEQKTWKDVAKADAEKLATSVVLKRLRTRSSESTEFALDRLDRIITARVKFSEFLSVLHTTGLKAGDLQGNVLTNGFVALDVEASIKPDRGVICDVIGFEWSENPSSALTLVGLTKAAAGPDRKLVTAIGDGNKQMVSLKEGWKSMVDVLHSTDGTRKPIVVYGFSLDHKIIVWFGQQAGAIAQGSYEAVTSGSSCHTVIDLMDGTQIDILSPCLLLCKLKPYLPMLPNVKLATLLPLLKAVQFPVISSEDEVFSDLLELHVGVRTKTTKNRIEDVPNTITLFKIVCRLFAKYKQNALEVNPFRDVAAYQDVDDGDGTTLQVTMEEAEQNDASELDWLFAPISDGAFKQIKAGLKLCMD